MRVTVDRHSWYEAVADGSLMEQAFFEHLLCADTRLVTESATKNE